MDDIEFQTIRYLLCTTKVALLLFGSVANWRQQSFTNCEEDSPYISYQFLVKTMVIAMQRWDDGTHCQNPHTHVISRMISDIRNLKI